MKKFLAMLLALVMALSLVACGEKKDDTQGNGDGDATAAKVKVGFITLHDENSTYDKNFIDAAKEACANLGLVENEDYFIKTNVGETEQCAEVAADLVDAGCNIIFADSFGHEPYMIEVAKANPEVQFCHSTGTRAHTEGLANYHNAFASIYEGRYLAGIAAGLKLNAMIEAGDIKAEEAKMGYVGAFTYAEVVSGYTSFYLGAKSVCPTVTMDVTKAITEIKAGKVEHRLDKTAIIHCPVGKVSFGAQKIQENLTALMEAINKAKPAAAKGVYVRSLYISSTMGPSVRVNPLKF